MGASLRRYRALWVGALLLLAAGLLVGLEGLGFAPLKDERHFWPSSLYFRDRLPPTLEELRGYRDLNTPLPFLLFGLLERLFGGGIQVGRWVNLVLGLAVLGWLGWPRAQPWAPRLKAALGLLAFPYFLFCSVLLYTDVLAVVLVLLGARLHLGGRVAWGAVAFTLAIAARQPMVAFPLGLLLWELGPERRGQPGLAGRLVALGVAAASLGSWFLLFGGVSPPAALVAQHVATASALRVHPHQALYLLACLGAWFVVPESLLFSEVRREWSAVPRARWGLWALVLLGLFVCFPPWGNLERPIVWMGALDRVLRVLLPDVGRLCVLWGLALLAAVRLLGPPQGLPGWWVVAQALVLMKSPSAWDKHALALLVLLWALRAEASEARTPLLTPSSLPGELPSKEPWGSSYATH